MEIQRALRAGAAAYVPKSTPKNELLRIIRTVAAGQRHIPAEVAGVVAQHLGQEDLTARELDVLQHGMLPINEPTLSQIDDDIADRLRAANEKVAGGWLFEWLGSVDDCPGNQTALTVVTNAGAAGPKGGDVANFGQLQNALIF
jgi:hypothetical protein